MTKKEMSEIFGGMILAWPNAEMFRGGLPKLKPTVELWASCLPEIDLQTGQQALRELCRKCKFPPTIAEFRMEAEALKERMEAAAWTAWDRLKSDSTLTSLQEAYDRLPPHDLTRTAIDRMGGPTHLIRRFEDGEEIYQTYEFVDTYRRLLQQPEVEGQLWAMGSMSMRPATERRALDGKAEGFQAPASGKAGQGRGQTL